MTSAASCRWIEVRAGGSGLELQIPGVAENDGEGDGSRGILHFCNKKLLIRRRLAQTMKGGVRSTPPFIIVL